MAEEKRPYAINPEQNAQLIHLLEDCAYNIRLAKTQQWQVGYYTLLVYVAIVFAAQLLHEMDISCLLAPDTVVVIGSALILAVGIGGLVVMWTLQVWMGQQRTKLKEVEKYCSPEYQQLATVCRPDNYRSISYAWRFAWLLTSVVVGGGTVSALLLVFRFAVPWLLTSVILVSVLVSEVLLVVLWARWRGAKDADSES